MTAKTHFSFELFYAAESATTQQQRDQVMQTLEQSLTALFAADDAGGDAAASVAVSSSHKGADNKLVELFTVLQDDQIAKTLNGFCRQNGLVWEALE